MPNDYPFSDFINEISLQTKMENVWSNTCGSWQNCNELNLQEFLSQCLEYNMDPQFCMSWVEQHQGEIPNWPAVSSAALDWVNQHTSSGSPYSETDFELS